MEFLFHSSIIQKHKTRRDDSAPPLQNSPEWSWTEQNASDLFLAADMLLQVD